MTIIFSSPLSFFRAKRKADLCKTEIRGELVPALQRLLSEYQESTQALRNELGQLQDDAEDAEGRISQLVLQENSLETKLRRVEEIYRREKESLESVEAAHQQEMDGLEGRLLRLRDVSADEARAVAAARRAVEAQAAVETGKLEHARSKRAIAAAVMEAVSVCAENREAVQSRLCEVREAYRQSLESLLLGKGLGADRRDRAAQRDVPAESLSVAEMSFIQQKRQGARTPDHGKGVGLPNTLSGLPVS